MRTLFYSLVLLLSTTLFSCSNSEELSQQEETGFFTPTLETKFDSLKTPRTSLDGNTGNVKWTADDQLLVFVHETGKAPRNTAEWKACRYKFVTDANNCTKNLFKQEADAKNQLQLDPKKNYDWYVMAPYSEGIISPMGDGNFTISHQQADMNNATAHVGNTDVMTSLNRGVKSQEKVSIALKHLTTLMMFRLKNGTNAAFTPQYVEFETQGAAPITLGGSYKVNFEKGLTAVTSNNNLRITFSNSTAISPAGTFDVYAVMVPFTLAPNDAFNVRVVTDKSNTVQTSVMSNTISFTAGTINRAKATVTEEDKKEDINPWESQGDFEDNIQI